ncbi:hypothetical protein GAMM_30003 [Gammaproteobacteria bacterium]
MKPMHDFVNAHLIPIIEGFRKATRAACTGKQKGEKHPEAALAIDQKCAVILLHLREIGLDKNENNKLIQEPLFSEMKSAFYAMKELGTNSEAPDAESAKLIEGLVTKFDDNFYTELGVAVKSEVKATAGVGMFASFIPQSAVISGIKSVLGEKNAYGNDYSSFMRDLFDKSFLNKLRAQVLRLKK